MDPDTPRVTKAIPADQPFVVRNHFGKRLLPASPIIGLAAIVGVCGGGMVVAGAKEGKQAAALGTGVTMAVVCLALSILVPYLLLVLLFGRKPVLAVGPDGLWIKSRPSRGQAIWLPWAAIARIEQRKLLWEKTLVVTPNDIRVLKGLGAYTAVDSWLIKTLWGTTLTATISFADRTEEQIFSALRGYSAGRCPIA